MISYHISPYIEIMNLGTLTRCLDSVMQVTNTWPFLLQTNQWGGGYMSRWSLKNVPFSPLLQDHYSLKGFVKNPVNSRDIPYSLKIFPINPLSPWIKRLCSSHSPKPLRWPHLYCKFEDVTTNLLCVRLHCKMKWTERSPYQGIDIAYPATAAGRYPYT